MTDARPLSESLPALRRYARAVTASASLGDKSIENLLEKHLSGQLPLPSDAPDSVAGAFRVLDSLLKADDSQLAPADASAIHRRALLLTAMEEFSLGEAAYILEIPEAALPELLKMAEENLKETLATSVLIIEDEVLIARHLGTIVEELGHTVCAHATTREEAVKKADETRPHLILADVKLADGSLGSDAASDIWEKFPDMPIIFITAYPELLLTGEKREPDFLIPKPFRPEYVQAVISQALIGKSIAA